MKTLEKLSQEIKLFSDGADESTLLEMNQTPWIAGMTTNPSLMKKAGVKDYRGFSQKILQTITKKPISFEVFADDLPTMLSQAEEIATWGKNVYVKIPVINTKGEATYSLIEKLTKRGIQLNITAIFTFEQSLRTAEALKGGAPSIVSVFAGRIADVGIDPEPFVIASSEACKMAGPQVELLWASTREVYNISQAIKTGCQIITAPADVLKKLNGFGKTPMDLCFDTVKTFKADSESAGFTL
jgi:transaldolase